MESFIPHAVLVQRLRKAPLGTRRALCALLGINYSTLHRYIKGEFPREIEISIWAILERSAFLKQMEDRGRYTIDHLRKQWLKPKHLRSSPSSTNTSPKTS